MGTLNATLMKLKKVGFSPEALAQFNLQLQAVAKRHSLQPAEVRDRLLQELKSLDKGLALETLVKSRKHQLKEITKTIAENQAEIQSLKVAIDVIQQ